MSLYSRPGSNLNECVKEPEDECLRLQALKTWYGTELYRKWDKAVLIFSIASAIMYVVETYSVATETPIWSKCVEVIVAAFFSADYVIRMYLSESRCRFALKGTSVLDILCILPVVFVFVLDDSQGEASQFIFFLQFLRVVRLIRILRGYRVVTVSKRGDPDNLKKQINILVYTLLTLIFITAALLHLVEKTARVPWLDNEEGNPQLSDFHDAVYFVVITLTTVGYGDITPKTAVGRVMVMIFVTASVIIIPRETGKLSELMALTSHYGGTFVPQENRQHVLVCGYFDYGNLLSFLMEFFHEAHGHHQMVVVLLSPAPPTKTIKLLFGQNGIYGSRVQYFEGSSLDDVDLHRMKFSEAVACFFLSDKLTTEPQATDCETIMRVLSVKNHAPEVPVFVQLLMPENKEQVVSAGADHVVCLRELKMNILAMSSIVSGFSTLFCNLFRNEGEDVVVDETSPDDDSSEERRHLQDWLNEYCHGISYEIYPLEFPQAFVGRTFGEVCCFVYAEWESLLFAVQKPQEDNICMLHPSNSISSYVICKSDRGFLFATDSKIPKQIEVFEGDLVIVSQSTRCGGPNFTDISKVDNTEGTVPSVAPEEDLLSSLVKRSADNVSKQTNIRPMPPLIPLMSCDADENYKVSNSSRIIEEAPPTMSGHIIVVSHQPQYLPYYMTSLRGYLDPKLGPVPAVIVMLPSIPELPILRTLVKFPELFFFIGSGRCEQHFHKCRAQQAKTCIVLFSATFGGTKLRYPTDFQDANGEDMIADFDAIAAFTCLKTATKQCENPPFVVVELVHKQNTRYLPPRHNETLLGKVTESNDYIVPSYAAGRVFSDQVMDALLCQVFYNPELLLVLQLFLAPAKGYNGFQSSKLTTIPVPSQWVGETFTIIMKHLVLKYHMLPIGFYRSPVVKSKSNAPYVFLCPKSDSRARRDDRLFVLACDAVRENMSVFPDLSPEDFRKPSNPLVNSNKKKKSSIKKRRQSEF